MVFFFFFKIYVLCSMSSCLEEQGSGHEFRYQRAGKQGRSVVPWTAGGGHVWLSPSCFLGPVFAPCVFPAPTAKPGFPAPKHMKGSGPPQGLGAARTEPSMPRLQPVPPWPVWRCESIAAHLALAHAYLPYLCSQGSGQLLDNPFFAWCKSW